MVSPFPFPWGVTSVEQQMLDLHTAFLFPILRAWRLSCSFTEAGLFSHFLREHTTALKERMFLGVCFWDRMPKKSVWSPVPVGSAGVEWDIAALPISCSSSECSSTAGWLLFVQHLSMPQPSHAKPHWEGFVVFPVRTEFLQVFCVFEPCRELILQILEGKLSMLGCCSTRTINLDYLLCLLINCASVSFADCRTWHSIIRKGPLQLKAVLKLVPRLRKKLWRKSGSPMKMILLLWMWVFLGCGLFFLTKIPEGFWVWGTPGGDLAQQWVCSM